MKTAYPDTIEEISHNAPIPRQEPPYKLILITQVIRLQEDLNLELSYIVTVTPYYGIRNDRILSNLQLLEVSLWL